MHMSGFLKTVWKNSTSALSGRFFLARNSKVDDIKITSKVSAFFLPLHVYLPFATLLSLLFARLQGLKKTLKFSEIEYRSDDVTKIIFLKLWDMMSYSYRRP